MLDTVKLSGERYAGLPPVVLIRSSSVVAKISETPKSASLTIVRSELNSKLSGLI